MGRIYIRTADSEDPSELIDVSLPPVHITARPRIGMVSIGVPHIREGIVVARLPEGQKEDAGKVADALADMFAYADEARGEERHSRIIEFTPELETGYWTLSSTAKATGGDRPARNGDFR